MDKKKFEEAKKIDRDLKEVESQLSKTKILLYDISSSHDDKMGARLWPKDMSFGEHEGTIITVDRRLTVELLNGMVKKLTIDKEKLERQFEEL